MPFVVVAKNEKQWSFLTSAELFEIFEFSSSLPPFLSSFLLFHSFLFSFLSSSLPSIQATIEISKHPIEWDTVRNNGDSDSEQTTILLSELFSFVCSYKVWLNIEESSYLITVVLALSKFKNIVFQFQVFSQMYFKLFILCF